jgi:thymidylate synthase
MAYDARQRQIMAYALALSGGNIASAARWLKSNSVECGAVGESTLRRIRDDDGMESEIEHQRALIQSERDTAVRSAERNRLKHEIEGTFVERVRSMEKKGWELLDKLSEQMESSTNTHELLNFWRIVQGYVLQLKKQSGDGIHELWQAEVLVRATRECLQEKLGPALADNLTGDIGKRYEKLAAQRLSREAEGTDGQKAEAAATAV